MSPIDNHQPYHILLADDGSQHAQAAVAMLRDIPLPPNSKITILGVFTPRQADRHFEVIEVQGAGLERSKASLEGSGAVIETELILGYPAEKIIEFAERLHPDLVVLGAKGLRATLGILLGGVAQQVVEYATFPVLVVRAPYSSLQHILVVVDGSVCSQKAVQYVTRMPLPAMAQVHLMHVLPPVILTAAAVPTHIMTAAGIETMMAPLPHAQEQHRDWEIEEQRLGESILKQNLETLQSAGIKAQPVMLRGDAATEIIEYSHAHAIDLIIAGIAWPQPDAQLSPRQRFTQADPLCSLFGAGCAGAGRTGTLS